MYVLPKIVAVDRAVAFVGGLDLCFGREDDASHELTDENSERWVGNDYANPRIRDWYAVDK